MEGENKPKPIPLKAIIACLIIIAIVVLVVVILKFVKEQQQRGVSGKQQEEDNTQQKAESAGIVNSFRSDETSMNSLLVVGAADKDTTEKFETGLKAALDSVSGAELSWYLFIWLLKTKPDINISNSLLPVGTYGTTWASGPDGSGTIEMVGQKELLARTNAIAAAFNMKPKDKSNEYTSYLLPNGDTLVVLNESGVLADLKADTSKDQKYWHVYDLKTSKFVSTHDAVWAMTQGTSQHWVNLALLYLAKSVGYKTIRWNPGANSSKERGVTVIPGTPIRQLLSDQFAKGLFGMAVMRHKQFFSTQFTEYDKQLLGMMSHFVLKTIKSSSPENFLKITAAKGVTSSQHSNTGDGYVGESQQLMDFVLTQTVTWDGIDHETEYSLQLIEPTSDMFKGKYDVTIKLDGIVVQNETNVVPLTELPATWGIHREIVQQKQRR